jgi:hypothetical protein
MCGRRHPDLGVDDFEFLARLLGGGEQTSSGLWPWPTPANAPLGKKGQPLPHRNPEGREEAEPGPEVRKPESGQEPGREPSLPPPPGPRSFIWPRLSSTTVENRGHAGAPRLYLGAAIGLASSCPEYIPRNDVTQRLARVVQYIAVWFSYYGARNLGHDFIRTVSRQTQRNIGADHALKKQTLLGNT